MRWRTVALLTSALGLLAAGTLALPVLTATPGSPGRPDTGAAPIMMTTTVTAASPLPPAPSGPPRIAVAPYYVDGWGDPPDPRTVMSATGVTWFTMAFVLSHGPCSPQWDGERPLTGGPDAATINTIRAAGGDVLASFGGASDSTLESSCSDATTLANAYQTVIDSYQLKAIDIDIEGKGYDSATTQQRTIDALRIIRLRDPSLVVYITFPTDPDGPDATMIDRAAHSGLSVTGWCVMPFDFQTPVRSMATEAMRTTDRLAALLAKAYGYSSTAAYQHSGLSTMGGITDARETVTVADFRAITAYATLHELARLTFWAVNRDRPCPGRYPNDDSCSGIHEQDWSLTATLARYTG